MKKQLTILALACMGIVLPAASGLITASAQEVQKTAQAETNEFRINHISSTDEASKFSLRFSDEQLKSPSLRIYNDKGDEIYNAPIEKDYMVFKVITEEPAATLTFALFDGKKKITSRTWQISTVNETKVVAKESR